MALRPVGGLQSQGCCSDLWVRMPRPVACSCRCSQFRRLSDIRLSRGTSAAMFFVLTNKSVRTAPKLCVFSIEITIFTGVKYPKNVFFDFESKIAGLQGNVVRAML